MSEIYVDYPALQTAARDFGRRHQTLTTILSDLEAGLAPMIGSWEGSAREMYMEKKAAWDAAAADLAVLLHAISAQTQAAHDGYAEVVTHNVTDWT